ADLRRLASTNAVAADGIRLSVDPPDPPRHPRHLRADRGSDAPDPLDVAARAAAAARSGDPDGVHAAALVDLRWGDSSVARFGRVIALLETAARTSDGLAPVLADLAAARLVYAERTLDGRALAGALDAAARAVARDANDLQARYDLTLVLDRAGLTGEAATSARAYLARDSTSAWADRLRNVARGPATSADRPPAVDDSDRAGLRAFVRRDHGRAREFGTSAVLARWSDAVLRGDVAAADRAARLATGIGRVLVDDGGDASLLDEANAASHARGAAAASLARAHREFVSGSDYQQAGEYERAGAALERALAEPAAPAMLRWWARALLGAVYVHEGHAARGARLLRGVVAAVDTGRYPALAWRALASLGTATLRAGRDDEAARVIAAAERTLDRAGETERLGAVQFLRADAEMARGAGSDGYATAWRALGTLRAWRGSVWRHNVLYVLAQEAELDGMPRAALRVQDEGVSAAERTGRPLDLAEALLARSRLVATADRAAAEADIRRARAIITTAPAGSDRDWIVADFQLSRARVELATDPREAAADADSAATFFARRNVVVRVVAALAARAEARAAAGDADAALADLTTAIRLTTTRAEHLRETRARSVLLNAARPALDRLVLLRLGRGERDAALGDVEHVRALLVASDIGRPPYPAHAAVRPAGPKRETAIVLTRIADTILTWVVRDTAAQFARTVVRAGALDRIVA
ncbi:MAG TPA: hypothetical protein VGD56_14025, partial [Gemmatirosa sp.]